MAGETRKAAEKRIAFGEFLRMKRNEAKIGLREFARRVGVSPAYVSRIEHGRDNPPKIETLEKMEKVLGVTPAELVAMANEVPSDFVKAFTRSKVNREMLPQFMRVVRDGKLTKEDWEKLIKSARQKGRRE
jgi:transcriptional regulator with XRE-family HTH domain